MTKHYNCLSLMETTFMPSMAEAAKGFHDNIGSLAIISDDEESFSETSSDESSSASDSFSDSSCASALQNYGDLEGELASFLESSHRTAPVTGGWKGGNSPISGESAPIDIENELVLSKIKSDLLNLGTMFAQQGDAFRERAKILSSINYLATNVPTCVLDHLGREVRQFADSKTNVSAVDSVTSTNTESCWSPKHAKNYAGLEEWPDSGSCSCSYQFDDMVSSTGDYTDSGDYPACDSWSKNSTPSNQDEELNESKSISSFKSGWGSCFSDLGNSDRHRACLAQSVLPLDFCVGSAPSLPYIAPFQGVVLLGFTSLSKLHGPEIVSKLTNSYFQLVVKYIFDFDGDVQKYAGDALFAEWRQTDYRSMADCANRAALCTCKLSEELSNLPVTVQRGLETVTSKMNLHYGLGCGETVGIHIGDDTTRREYLHVGEAIKQATDACKLATTGEVVISEKFRVVLEEGCPDRLFTVVQGERGKCVLLVGTNKAAQEESFLRYKKKPEEIARSRAITPHVEGLSLDALREYRRLIALYCHPVVKISEQTAKPFLQNGSYRRPPDEPELRRVFVAFLSARLSIHERTGSGAIDLSTIRKVNEVRNIVSKELIQFNGYSESFIDDKGFSLMLTFGLRGSAFPDLVGKIALPATLLVQNVLKAEADLNSIVGATFGLVYCGFLGGEQRREYTVIGPTVNLAARLMTYAQNPGIIVDKSVYQQSYDDFTFVVGAQIAAKGFVGLIDTYLPVAQVTESKKQKPLADGRFIGRKEQIARILTKASAMATRRRSQSELVLISAPHGAGKTAFLSHLSCRLKSVVGKIALCYLSCNMLEGTVPFSGLVSLFDTAPSLDPRSQSDNEDSINDMSIYRRPISPDSIVAHLQPESSTREVDTLHREILQLLSTMAGTTDLLVLTIDDCHFLDKHSWWALCSALDTVSNVLVVGTTTTDSPTGFRMSQETRNIMWNEFLQRGVLSIMSICELNRDEVREMLAGLTGKMTVRPDLLHEVIVESGGMPRYVEQALNNSLHAIHRDEDPKHTEIFLRQFDTLPNTERSFLSISACLGREFSAVDVLKAYGSFHEDNHGQVKRTGEVQKVRTSELDALVERGLLRRAKSCTGQREYADSSYFEFCRPRWRSAVRQLVLDSRIHTVNLMSRSLQPDISNTPTPNFSLPSAGDDEFVNGFFVIG